MPSQIPDIQEVLTLLAQREPEIGEELAASLHCISDLFQQLEGMMDDIEGEDDSVDGGDGGGEAEAEGEGEGEKQDPAKGEANSQDADEDMGEEETRSGKGAQG
ncbi:unnamed protein product [Parajaminaea phylloscopi]